MNPLPRALWIAAAVFFSAMVALAQQPTSPHIEIDNVWVHVIRVKLAPGEKAPAQDPLPYVTVFLTDAREKITGADGKMQDNSRKAGDVSFNDSAARGDENIGSAPLEKVVVELKPGATPAAPVALDPVKLDHQHHLVPLENDRVRVLRTILEPHLKAPMHEHPHYVVVYMTELHTTMLLGDGKAVDNVRHPGEVAWRDYMKHATENIGDRQAVEIQIELKR